MLGDFKDFASSDLLGVKFDAKTGDMLGNLKVFTLSVLLFKYRKVVKWPGRQAAQRQNA